MKKKDRRAVQEELIHEIEEEDIGISLLSIFYQNNAELCFFKSEDREKILKILRVLSEDSRRHKEILERLISYLGGARHEK